MTTLFKKVDWGRNEGGLSQALSSGLEFALVSPNGCKTMPFAYCKDYLQDALMGYLHHQPASIFGFSYDPKAEHQPGIDRVRLVLANSSDKQMRDKIPACSEFVHQFEDRLGIPHSTFVECSNPPPQYKLGGVFYVEGHQRWLAAPVMISLYTLLLRVGFSHTPGTDFMKTMNAVSVRDTIAYQPMDNYRVSGGLPGINFILEHGDVAVFGDDLKKNYPCQHGTEVMHNSMGIVAFSSGSCVKYAPHWKHPAKK